MKEQVSSKATNNEIVKLNPQQKAAVQYNGNAQNLLVIAGAGCGKTRTIISREVYIIYKTIDIKILS